MNSVLPAMSLRLVVIPARMILFGLFCGSALLPAVDNAPTPAQLKEAENVFRDVYGKEFDRISRSRIPSDKAAFARKLWDASRSSADDPALSKVLADHATTLANQAEASGLSLLLEIARSRVTNGPERPSQLAAVASILEKMARGEKPDRRAKLGQEIIDLYREAADLSHEMNRPNDVASYHSKASFAARSFLPPNLSALVLKDIAADKAEHEADRRRAAEIEKLQSQYRANPTDPKINQTMAFLALRNHKWIEAIEHLQASGHDRLKQIAGLLSQKPAADPITLGDVYRSAADEFPAEKNLLQSLARQQYELALAKNPKTPEAARLRLLIKEWQNLPAANNSPNIIPLIDENADIVDAFLRDANGTAKLSWDSENGVLGQGALRISAPVPGTPAQRRLAVGINWQYPLVELPQQGQNRYLRVSFRQLSGTRFRLTLLEPSSAVIVNYVAGKLLDGEKGIVLTDPPPPQWLHLTRDVVADRGMPGTVGGLIVETDGVVLLDGLYLGRSIRDLNRLIPKNASTNP